MRKINLIYKSVILLLLSGLLCACPLFPSKTYELLIDQETKDYCLFGEDSYWIYQDFAALNIDSVVVDKPVRYELGNYGEYNTWVFENYDTFFSLYSIDTTYVFFNRLTSKEANENSLEPCVLWGLTGAIYHNGTIKRDVGQLIYHDKRDSYSINETIFNDIKIFMHYYYASYPTANQREIYYWAKHVGLIREEIYINDSVISVRNLIRYNVKQ